MSENLSNAKDAGTAETVVARRSSLCYPAFYEDAYATIYHGDCREILPTLGTFDVVMTDPPFGANIEYGSFEDTPDNVKRLIADVWPTLRAAAPVTLVACGVKNIGMYPEPDWVLTHVNLGGERSGPWGFACWMPVLVYGKDPYLCNGKGRRPDTFVFRPPTYNAPKCHPCPKHPATWAKFMARATIGESRIVDPFMGSGTTLVSAKYGGHRAVGIEIEERFCEEAANRLRQGVLPFTG